MGPIKKESLGLFLGFASFFVFFQLKSVYGGDSGDFLSAAAVWGVPHPPGYPLYTFLAGLLHNFFSFSTPAFRVAFLSSIPSALAIVFLYKTLSLLVSKKISLIGCLFLGFSYPFWLYAEVAEVFALNSFFIVLISYLAVKEFIMRSDCRQKFANIFFFVLGLSLCHHHTILFLMPAIYFVFWKKRFFGKLRAFNLLFFILGLLPYAYLPLAAFKNPAVNWGNPVNLKNFFNLVSRRVYGTFVANMGILNDFQGRFTNILAFFRFVMADFGLIGAILIVLGILSIFFAKKKKQKLALSFFLIGLLSFVFFIFYASFNIYSDFNVATFERFLIAPYIFLASFAALGLEFVLSLAKRLAYKNKQLISSLFLLAFFVVLPAGQLTKNYPRISILKNDLTAENFAQDILNSQAEEGVVFARSDTTHFNLQYLVYSLNYKKGNVLYINVFTLPASYYQEYLIKTYPKLNINKQKKDLYDWKIFLEENYDKMPIYSIPEEVIAGYESVPRGIIFQYFKKEDLPSAEEVVEINDSLWKSYNNPLAGSLSKYKNLFLHSAVYYYQGGAKRLGEYLIEKEKWEKAEEYLLLSLSYKIEDPETELLLGRVYLEQKKCQQAEGKFKKVKEMLPDNPFADAYLRQVYLECFKDEKKAKDFLDTCLQKEEKNIPKLEEL